MGRGYWRATAHGVAELDMTQKLRHTHTHTHTYTQHKKQQQMRSPFTQMLREKKAKEKRAHNHTQRNYNNYSKMAEV